VIDFLTGSRREQQTQRNRRAMLKRVNDFWVKGVLENSLQGAARLELGLEAQTGAVEQPWEMIVQTPKVSAFPILPSTRIGEVFTAMSAALLILGEPGSGKTTMLLELAREKIIEAKFRPIHDQRRPL
jgi:predicted NACHT family NTPase